MEHNKWLSNISVNNPFSTLTEMEDESTGNNAMATENQQPKTEPIYIEAQVIESLTELIKNIANNNRNAHHNLKSVLRIKYFPVNWKIAQVVMLPKSKKDPHLPSLYRPISLLPLMSNLLEKIILSPHQFSFRNKYATIEQVHRLTNKIYSALEQKKCCTAVFLDIEKTLDKI